MADKRKVALAVANDPNTIMSYGILVDWLMKSTASHYRWNLISEEYQYGKPEVYGDFIKWRSGKDSMERDSKVIPDLIKKLRPEFLVSIGDLQYFKMTRHFITKETPWIHWTPIDNNDKVHLMKSKAQIRSIDLPVAMSKFARDFAVANNVPMTEYIYPFIKCKPTAVEAKRVAEGDKRIFEGYKPLKEGTKGWTEIEKFKKTLKVKHDEFIIMFVGRPGWRKNIEFLIGILKKLVYERERKDIVLYMHTDIRDPSSTIDLAKLLHAFQIPEDNFIRTKNLDWDSGIPNTLLNLLYNMADLNVSPHGGEGFWLPCAEAMATQTPFVATDCTTTQEFAGNSERGLGAKVKEINPDRGILRPYVDLDDFCDKVEYMLDHETVRKRMGKAGRQWVLKNCSVPVITKKWLKLFDSIDVNRVEIGGIIDQ